MGGRDSDVDVDAEALGRAVAAMRAEQGLRRRDLQERSGLSYPYISEIENGSKRPSMSALGKLATALGVTPAELLERAEVISKPSRADMRMASMAYESSPSLSADEPAPEGRGSRWFHADRPSSRPPRSTRRPAVEDRRVGDLTVSELEALIRAVVRDELRRPPR